MLWLILALFGSPDLFAQLRSPLSRNDMDGALAIARSRAEDRARFHTPYIVTTNGPIVEYLRVERIEVVTEFRRLVLLGEQHALANDMFGRGGLQHVEEALRPWRGRVSIAVYFQFLPTMQYITGVPPIQILLRDTTFIRPLNVVRKGVSPESSGDEGVGRAMSGGIVEGTFDSDSVGNNVRQVFVEWNGKELYSLSIDFAKLR